MDWQALIRDKRVLYGGAAAAGLGLYALVKRKRTTGSYSGGAAAATPGAVGNAGYLGAFNTTGTDIAGWAGDFMGNVGSELRDYQKQLIDAIKELDTKAPTGPTTSTPLPAPAPAPAPPPPPPPPPPQPQAQYQIVDKWLPQNTPWNSTLWGIATHYGTSVSALLNLNPGIANPNLIYPNQQIRIA